MKKMLIILADGFEEIEAVGTIDVLRRLGTELVVAGFKKTVDGAHGIGLSADITLEKLDPSDYSAVILPGGLPGAENLRNSRKVVDIVKEVYGSGGIAAAICAAPIVLAEARIIEGRKVTGYPMPLVKDAVAGAGGEYTGSRAETDGRIVTGKGPGAVFEFAFALAGAAGNESGIEELARAMFVVSG